EGIHHFHGHPGVSEKMAGDILHRLKLDNHTINMVTKLVKYHDYDVEPEERSVRRAVLKIGEDVFPYLFDVKQADIRAQSVYMRREKEAKLEAVRQVYHRIMAQNQCISLKMLAVSGKDLIDEAGMKPGRELGLALKKLLDMVVDDPSLNEKEILLKTVKEFQ
ncbi:MAG: polynucleotide adenylyltransferase, partial [Lachnospiraceae bacterium]|nr:polynucleotide adenylyltransferase [Lachnospiraceae bacterium]